MASKENLIYRTQANFLASLSVLTCSKIGDARTKPSKGGHSTA